MAVKAQTNLVRRGTVYYFRKKVPKDLREHYQGKEAIRRSLGAVSDLNEAKSEARRLADSLEAQFQLLRRRQSALPAPLTEDLIPVLARAIEGHMLQADDEIRLAGLSEEELQAHAQEVEQRRLALRGAYARGDSSAMAMQCWRRPKTEPLLRVVPIQN